MKNKFLYTALTSLVLLTSSSCESVFDYDADDRLTYDEVFEDFSLAQRYLNNCYEKVPALSAWSAGTTFLSSFTDESQDIYRDRPLAYYNGEMTSSNQVMDANLYDNLNEGIRHCNIFIANIDKVDYFNVETYRSRWKGEAYILRAFFRLQLIKRFGPMPIINEAIDATYDYSEMVRPTFYECVQAIMADCDKGLAEPELLWRVADNNQLGSMTAPIAYAIKSQAILFAASPLWNNGENHWAEAAKVTKEALTKLTENGSYALYNPNTVAVKGSYSSYQDYFFQTIGLGEGTKNKEAIYQKKGANKVWDSYGIPILKSVGVTSAGMSPVQELVDAYETSDGVPILNLEQPYLDEEHLQPNYNPAALKANGGLYDPENPYENRDVRLKSTVYYNGVYHNQEKNEMQVFTQEGGNCHIDTSDKLYTVTGYYLRKFVNWNSTSQQQLDGYWSYFRLAELYLNYAEAELEANGATPEAYAAVTAVRERSNMPGFPAGLSSDDFRLRLRNERRVEFAFEEQRYFDLRRWEINKEYEGVVTGMKITADANNKLTYERFVVRERNVVEDKYSTWPIPLNEELKFKRVGVDMQNIGW